MKKQILCLSGWGQKFDSLEDIFFDKRFSDYSISSLDYSSFGDVEKFFEFISSKKYCPEIVVGWSLGGQLSLRLIQKEILKPKKLILIAPPFQMVKDQRISAAMARNVFEEFYNNFKNAPDNTLQKFAILMAMNDKNAKEIAKNLDINQDNFQNLTFWLEELERFSCFDFDFEKTPETLFFQGKGDMIVHNIQAGYFKERIRDFKLELFENCGHAPHLSDVEKFRVKVLEFLF